MRLIIRAGVHLQHLLHRAHEPCILFRHRFSREFNRHPNITWEGVVYHWNWNVGWASSRAGRVEGRRCQGTARRMGLWARRGKVTVISVLRMSTTPFVRMK